MRAQRMRWRNCFDGAAGSTHTSYHASVLIAGDEVRLTALDEPPSDALVFSSDRDGAAMLEGWSDEGRWRWLLPWPEETRSLPWRAAAEWKRLFAELEADVPVDSREPLEAPFLGGWVGLISYEAAATEEALTPHPEGPPEPAMFFARHTSGVVIDPDGRAFLFGPANDMHARREALHRVVERRASAIAGRAMHDSLGGGAHRAGVERIREAIRDGDVYQVNLTRAFTVEGGSDPATLYRALTGTAPPRSSAWLRADGCAIASASPEVLLRFDRVREIAETRPIKGTVRREGDDEAEVAALLASEKDAAEHLMIVDVSRNDLGKVADPGSVAVSGYRVVRTLEFVHHLESIVQASTPGCSAAEVVAALSPAASITGAPKRAAVRMIRELEPVPRGVYCGSIGFIGRKRVELSVAIRTAVATGDAVRFHAGGGIVWDSDAAGEDDETVAKAEAFLRYAGGAR